MAGCIENSRNTMDEHDYSCLSRKEFPTESKMKEFQTSPPKLPEQTVVTEESCIRGEDGDEDIIDVSVEVEENTEIEKDTAKVVANELETLTDNVLVNDKKEKNESPKSKNRCPTTRILSDAKKEEEEPLVTGFDESTDAYEDVSEFYFESDHLALRGNADYLALLKTIAVLEAQRTRAIRDFEELVQAQDAALADPIAFVEKLQRNENLNLPNPQKIAEVPTVDWNRYLISFNPNSLDCKRMTRRKLAEELNQQPSDTTVDPIQNLYENSTRSNIKPTKAPSEGRSQTFNQPWTADEQKKLEELLVKHQSEDVESRRWEKIARSLGNRTRQQVASRVQKYFIKLTKAGLPVPGRIPNISNYIKRGHSHRHQRHNRYLFQPSTFFASYEPPVYMCENEDDTISSCNISCASSTDGDAANDKMACLSDDENVSQEHQNSEEYKELEHLLKLKNEKLKTTRLKQHTEPKCLRCKCVPITGTTWQCSDCPKNLNIIFCEDCFDCNYEDGIHSNSHTLRPVAAEPEKPYVDRDYTTFTTDDYNYLDPNYMAAA